MACLPYLYSCYDYEDNEKYIGYLISTTIGLFTLKIVSPGYASATEETSKYCSHPLDILEGASIVNWEIGNREAVNDVISPLRQEAEKENRLLSCLPLTFDIILNGEVTKVYFIVINIKSKVCSHPHEAIFTLKTPL